MITKPCPECSGTLVERNNRHTNKPFLGCSNYPECKHTEEIPEAKRMEALGATTLLDYLEQQS
jgi:DNA topoisomerase-1